MVTPDAISGLATSSEAWSQGTTVQGSCFAFNSIFQHQIGSELKENILASELHLRGVTGGKVTREHEARVAQRVGPGSGR